MFIVIVLEGANSSSQLEKEIGSDHLLSNEHFYGLVNALYFCRPFREKILQYKQQLKKSYDKESGREKENLLTCLADLFHNIATQKKRVGTIAPKRFITKLKKENGIFDNFSQQDAHEFLNYLLNTISETLAEEKKAEKVEKMLRTNGVTKSGSKSDTTWIQEIFQGTLTNETRCLNCETVRYFFVDVEQNASITHCLRVFSDMETLQGSRNIIAKTAVQSMKYCSKTYAYQKLPQMLALHLKRFKYVEQMNRHTKLSYRSDDAVNRDRLYDLCAVVVHCGSTPNRGHYITLVKSHNFWLLFDDDIVDVSERKTLLKRVFEKKFFGLSECGVQKNSESAYILFYEARDTVNTDIKGGAGQVANSSI
ncbi:Ubiquitin carboxyl-terminal hydrolase 46 [Dirofilaria immitis]|nr:Ubiquitin carboxyl-terminal hydrolase 46 [Dirofilaria immitis]